MAPIMLNVPVYAQAKDNSCWNAAAQMIWDYSLKKSGRVGPMATHFKAYAIADKAPLQYHQFSHFMKQVGLKSIPKKSTHSYQDLWKYLSQHGPILCSGKWFGFGHAIVLTGVSETMVYFNDPDGGRKKVNTIDWWNEKLFSDYADTLMYKDPSRY